MEGGGWRVESKEKGTYNHFSRLVSHRRFIVNRVFSSGRIGYSFLDVRGRDVERGAGVDG